MRRITRLSVVVACALLASSCSKGPSEKAVSSPSPSPSVTASASPTATPSETEEQRHEREKRELGYTPKSPPPGDFIPANRSPKPGALTLSVRFEPTCVERGKIIRLIAKTNRPNTRVSFISPMPNPAGRATESDGRTDDKGLWRWDIIVRPDVEARTYEMLGAAIDDDSQGTGEGHNVLGNWFFVVAKTGECRSS